MEPVTSSIPMMVVEGNHEIEEQIHNKTFASYSSRFAFPSEESGSFSPFYYSFDVGGIHFFMLAAYVDYKKSGDTALSSNRNNCQVTSNQNSVREHYSVLINDERRS
jgi:hypothetical protein